MNYAIIGAGNVGKALAKAFARKGIDVTIASRRTPDELEPLVKELGASVTAKSLKEAVKADIVILAIPFNTHQEVANAAESWQGKTVIDVTNAYGISPEELGNRPSSVVIADSLPGASLVKAFNSLSAETLAEDPSIKGGKRVVFLSSDDEKATAEVASLVEQLGFAPVALGKLTEGGLLIQARGKSWAELIFQKFVKFD